MMIRSARINLRTLTFACQGLERGSFAGFWGELLLWGWHRGCRYTRNPRDRGGGFFIPGPAIVKPSRTLAHVLAPLCCSRENLSVVSTVPGDVGFVSRETDGSGIDNCLTWSRISVQKLHYSKIITSTYGLLV
jgi:hypothetical protein